MAKMARLLAMTSGDMWIKLSTGTPLTEMRTAVAVGDGVGDGVGDSVAVGSGVGGSVAVAVAEGICVGTAVSVATPVGDGVMVLVGMLAMVLVRETAVGEATTFAVAVWVGGATAVSCCSAS